MRQKRKNNLDDMESKKPGKDDDDPADLAAIAYAENNMGDYKLKMAADYEVPEDQAVNSEKKRRQMVLLEENMLNIKARFNKRFAGFSIK